MAKNSRKTKRIVCTPLSAKEICDAVGVTEADRRLVNNILAEMRIRKKPRG